MNKYISSKNLAFFIAIIILVSHYYLRTVNYNNWSNMLGWDVLAYYIYLPFTFIYGDPGITDQSIIEHIFQVYSPSGTFYQAFQLPNGNWSPMYSLGMAIFYTPFFFIGHIWALLSDYPADGFSFPYQFSIANGVMVYIIAGIFIIRKVLLKFFNDKISMLVMLFLLMGTSFFHESIADECGPHAILFAGFGLVLYLNIRWHETPTIKLAFWLGTVMGLSILARGSSIVLILVPVLWNVYDKESFNNKIALIIKHWKQIAIALVGFLIFPFVQMIYWKVTTGSFIFNTYQVTPGFDWLEPHIGKVLFSYKKGWLLYTPMIVFPLIGLFFLKNKKKSVFFAILSFVIINFYLISSWGTWWQGGSFGSRYFVESYAILSIPFGFLIQKIYSKRILKYVFTLLASLFLLLNVFQTWQFNNWIFDGYSMTKEYYWKVFLKTSVTDEDRKYREIIRTFTENDEFSNPQDYNKTTFAQLNFDSFNSNSFIKINPDFIDSSKYLSPPNSYKITKEAIYGPTFKIPYNKLTKREHAWIRATINYFPVHDLKESPVSFVIVMDHNEGQYAEKYRNWSLENYPYKVNEWNTLTVDYLTPYPLSERKDNFKIYVYLRGENEIYIDDIQLEVFERKW